MLSDTMPSDQMLSDHTRTKPGSLKTRLLLLLLLAFTPLVFTACEQIKEPVCANGQCLDFDRFGKNIQNACAKSVGYGYVIYNKGIAKSFGGFGKRRTDLDGSAAYDPYQPQHVASVSKTMTAIGALRVIEQKGIDVNASIADYLPAGWKRGANIGSITFANLLTHNSGFRGCSGCGDNTWAYLKALVEKGIVLKAKDTASYDNANFGIFRVLIPYMLGTVSDPNLDDDTETSRIYVTYMQEQVFAPAGATDVQPFPDPDRPTLAYPFPYDNKPGLKMGDFSKNCGGFGWYLSPMQAGMVMRELMRSEKLLTAAGRQRMLDNGFGIDVFAGKAHGTYYAKRGQWIGGASGINTVVAVFPDDVQVALFLNSDPAPENLLTLIIKAYDQSWQVK